MARRTRTRLTFRGAVVLLLIPLGAIVAWRLLDGGDGEPRHAAWPSTTPHARPPPSGTRPTNSSPQPTNTKVPGLTTWRGNATRNHYGKGPVPKHPAVRTTS